MYHCFVLKGGHVKCPNPNDVPKWATMTEFSEISMGFPRSCGVSSHQLVSCWDLSAMREGKVDVPGGVLGTWTNSYAYGPGSGACVLLTSGKLRCQAKNAPLSSGFTDAPYGNHALARLGSGLMPVEGVGCAVTTEGLPKCWNYMGKETPVPKDVAGVTAIGAAGRTWEGIPDPTRVCTLLNGTTVRCWRGETGSPLAIPKADLKRFKRTLTGDG